MQQRTQSCVRTAGDIVSTALGIIQYWEGTPPRVLISVLLIQNILRKKICSLQEYFEPKYSSKEKPERTYTYLMKLRMLHFGTRVLTICPLPGGRLVAHGQSVYPCHEDGIQFGPYLTTALDEVGCDVSLSWVGLGCVVLWLGWVRWCGGRRCR